MDISSDCSKRAAPRPPWGDDGSETALSASINSEALTSGICSSVCGGVCCSADTGLLAGTVMWGDVPRCPPTPASLMSAPVPAVPSPSSWLLPPPALWPSTRPPALRLRAVAPPPPRLSPLPSRVRAVPGARLPLKENSAGSEGLFFCLVVCLFVCLFVLRLFFGTGGGGGEQRKAELRCGDKKKQFTSPLSHVYPCTPSFPFTLDAAPVQPTPPPSSSTCSLTCWPSPPAVQETVE